MKKPCESSPPSWVDHLLQWFCSPHLLEEVQGDLYELYTKWVKQHGQQKANWLYILHTIKFLRPFAIDRHTNSYRINSKAMIRSYFKISLRNLQKNMRFVLLNAIGMGIALACCLTAYMLMAYNIEFNDFHRDEIVSNIYAIRSHNQTTDGGAYVTMRVPLVAMPIAIQEVPGIVNYTRWLIEGGYLRHKDSSFDEDIRFADTAFFDMFDFPLLYGTHGAFKNKHSIFLSEEMSKKCFGNENPVGEIMIANFANETEIALTIGGVIKKVPRNNSFNFDVLMPIGNYIEDIHKIAPDDWGDHSNPATFIKVERPEVIMRLGEKFATYAKRANEARSEVKIDSFSFHRFKEKYSSDEIAPSWINRPVESSMITVFVSMALVILLIACFSLTNTAIALTGRRLKEVGVRKSVGAKRNQILFQFLFETVLIMMLSLCIGALMVQIIVPAFGDMWSFQYGLSEMSTVNMFVMIMIVICFASLVAGLYPAIISSGLHPVSLLKGTFTLRGTNAFTRSLLTIQFALCVIGLVGGIAFIQNTKFQEDLSFGYNTRDVINIPIIGKREIELFENAIRSNPKIEAIGVSSDHVGGSSHNAPVKYTGVDYDSRVVQVGENYFTTMEFTFVSGREFNFENTSDREEGVIVNMAFLKKAGIKDPLDKIITIHDVKRHILGVIENHLDDLQRSAEPEPFIFFPADSDNYRRVVVRATPGNREEVQLFLEKTWKEIIPNKPFFSESQEDRLLKRARTRNADLKKTFLFLTILGGLLSVSGLYALATLNVTRRTKEIGIRKVLGASVRNIISLINREFVVILSIAALLGAFGGFFLTNALLDNLYQIHVEVELIPVFVCAILIIAIGSLISSTAIRKTAKTNPVETLRNE